MDPKLIKRGAIVLSIIVLVIVMSVACNALQNDNSTPTVSNPDETFMTYDGYTLSRQDVYERVKIMDGLSHLQNYIDTQLLSNHLDTDYISEVTLDEIDDQIKEMTYGVTNDAEIAEFSDRQIEDMEQNYHDTLVMNGFDPNDDDSVETFMRLVIAKDKYTKDAHLTTDENSAFFVNEDDLESYYSDYKQGTMNALTLRFLSSKDVENVLNHFDIVENYENKDGDTGLGLYDGDSLIEDVASDDFDDTNTTLLNEEETLETFIKIYNFIYNEREQLDTSATVSELIALENDFFLFDQYEMQKEGESSRTGDILDLSDYLFNSLSDSESPFSIRTKAIGDYRYMAYELERDEVKDFNLLNDTELEDLKAEYVEDLITTEQTSTVLQELYEEMNLKIHDSKLALSYEQQFNDDVYDEIEDNLSKLATLDEFEVTADDYFNYASERVGALYSLEILKEVTLFDSTYFEDTFGDNQDVFKNRSDKMKAFRDHVRTDKTSFNNGAYTNYGFSPQAMSWNEFLYAAYGLAGEKEYLNTLVVETIRSDYLYDEVQFTKVMEYVEEQYDNYFSLKADQLLVFVDMDENFAPDDFNDYYEGLTTLEQDTFDTKKAHIEDKIGEAIEDGDSLEDIVKAYKDASRISDTEDDDYSVWAEFKNIGLELKYENLKVQEGESQSENLNYNNTKNYVEEFVVALQDVYEEYTTQFEDEDELYASALTTTQFGIHLIRAEKGDNFDKPSAELSDPGEEYSDDLINEEAIPTLDQLKAYSRQRIENTKTQNVGGDGEVEYTEISEELFNSVDAFAATSYTRLFSNINHSIHTIDMIKDNAQFDENHQSHLEMYDTIRELFDRRTFPPLDMVE